MLAVCSERGFQFYNYWLLQFYTLKAVNLNQTVQEIVLGFNLALSRQAFRPQQLILKMKKKISLVANNEKK